MDNNESKVSQWVDDRLAALDPASDWQPDTVKALQRLHGRQRGVMRRRWISAAATAAAACLVLVALDPPSACATPRSCAENLVHSIRRAPLFAGALEAKRLDGIAAAMPAFKQTGSPTAPVTVEIYSDYECPYCARLFLEVVPVLMAQYVETGKVRLVHRDFPLPQHPYAELAVRYANSAGSIGQYDLAVNQIFKTQEIWSRDGNIESQLAQVLSPSAIERVRMLVNSDPKLDLSVAADVEMARGDSIKQTPTIVIVSRGKRQILPGVPALSLLKSYLDSLLAAQ